MLKEICFEMLLRFNPFNFLVFLTLSVKNLFFLFEIHANVLAKKLRYVLKLLAHSMKLKVLCASWNVVEYII